MESAIVGAIAALVGVPLVMAALARLYPRPSASTAGPKSDEELRREFRRWDLLSRGILLLVAPAAGYLWWRAFLASSS